MKISIKNISIYFIKINFCIILSIFILYINFIVLVNASIAKRLDWQIVLYILFSAITFLSIWILSFARIKFKKKFAVSLFFIMWLLLSKFLPNIQKQIDNDFCIDTGICKNIIFDYCLEDGVYKKVRTSNKTTKFMN